jgi:hypothetical protein
MLASQHTLCHVSTTPIRDLTSSSLLIFSDILQVSNDAYAIVVFKTYSTT